MRIWLATFFALAVSTGAADAQRRAPDPAETYSIPVTGSPARGAKSGHITLVVAADFADPYSRKLQHTLDKLRDEYPRELRIVHKHFVVHPQVATIPALASCAAHRQGKFWEMAELIWTRGNEVYRAQRDPGALGKDAMIGLARELGLSMRRFRRDLDGPACARTIREDYELMRRVGASGTPANYVNGRHLSGAQPIEAFRTLINEELREARRRTGNRRAKIRRYYRDWVVKRGVKEAPIARPRPRTGARPRPTPRPRPRPRRPDPTATYAVPLGNSPFRGPRHAKVTIVVACQFSGPFCKKIRPTLDQLLDKYGGDLKLVYKHFPVHAHKATVPAHAACAAHRQGKYWEMETLLWGSVYDGGDWSRERMRQAARSLDLDMDRFDADMDGACPRIVRDETAEMQRFGTGGTPTSYINGRNLTGARTVAEFERVIDEELRKANQRLRRGGAVKGYYARWVIAVGLQQFP
jgi:protein-disulfide isomerase